MPSSQTAMSGLLWLLLLAAALSDARSHRIPNALALAGALAGIALACAPGGIGWRASLAGIALACAPGGIGWRASLAGIAIGLAAPLPMYLARALGAGDVKLMAAVGAIVGAPAMPAMLAATFVAGGVMSIALAASRRRLRRLLANLREMLLGAYWRLACGEAPRLDAVRDSVGRMPYALAIAAGAGIARMLDAS